MEVIDIKRLQQEQSLSKILELAEVIGSLITEHAREYGMLHLKQSKGVDDQGLPVSKVEVI